MMPIFVLQSGLLDVKNAFILLILEQTTTTKDRKQRSYATTAGNAFKKRNLVDLSLGVPQASRTRSARVPHVVLHVFLAPDLGQVVLGKSHPAVAPPWKHEVLHLF